MKKFSKFLLTVLVIVSVVFGASQLMVDDLDAGGWSCGTNDTCTFTGQDCSKSLRCSCNGSSPFFWCWVGVPR